MNPLNFTRTQKLIFDLLMSEDIVNQSVILDLTGIKSIDTIKVHIHAIRKKLAAFDVAVDRRRFIGWFLTADNKARVRAMIEQEMAA